jgi:hypothetical protein
VDALKAGLIRTVLGTAGAALAALLLMSASALAAPTFRNVRIAGPPKGDPWTEPRIATGPDGRLWAVTLDEGGTAFAYSSADGGRTFQKSASSLAGQVQPTPDVDVVTMHTGRILASELDEGTGINFPTSYSDDGGRTWTQSRGSTQLADQDRQWFAVGPDDPQTHQPTVYLLFHNLASGNASHNMFVAKSTDAGATFGAPVPITLPGSPAWTDLQCADSGGPSTIFVNQQNGTVYAEYTTRGTPTAAGDLGGCAPLASGQPLEFNIVAGTRVWLAQSTDGGVSWSNSLAVDDAATQQIVSMQVAYAGLDTQGNVYVAYPESPLGHKYPDYSGAGVRYKFAAPTPDASQLHWSAPRTFAPASASAPGHVLVHLAVGYPGQLMGFYWTGVPHAGSDPVWYMTAAQTLDGFDRDPHVTEARISNVPTDTGSASVLMGACHPELGPVSGVVNGLVCDRSPDVWGVTVQQNCTPAIVWPAVDNKAAGNDPGTWVSTTGSSLCGAAPRGAALGPQRSLAPCRDRTPPLSHFRRTRASRRGVRFRGVSHDPGCSANAISVAGHVRRVYVSLARIRTRGHRVDCRFLEPNGRLTRYRSCHRPVLLRAHGTSRWTFFERVALPPGKYEAVVRGVDAAGNRELPLKSRNIEYFRVR